LGKAVLLGCSPFVTVLASAFGCGSDPTGISPVDTTPGPPVTLRVEPSTVGLNWIGASHSLSAVAEDDAGNVVSISGLIWQSRDTAVVVVDPAGVIEAKSVGTTLVTASSSGMTGTAIVRVLQIPAQVQLATHGTYIILEDSVQMNWTVVDSGGTSIPGAVPSWMYTSSVLHVSDSGMITANAVGRSIVTAVVDGASDTCAITVYGPDDPVVFELHGSAFGFAIGSADKSYVTQTFWDDVTSFDPATSSYGATIAVGSTPTDVVFGLAGNRAYVTTEANPAGLVVIDALGDSIVARVEVGARALKIAADSTGNIWYSTVTQWDIGTSLFSLDPSTLDIVPVADVRAAMDLTIHPTEPMLYATLPETGEVIAVDTELKSVFARYTGFTGPNQLVVAPDGRELYVAEGPMGIAVVDPWTGQLLADLKTDAGAWGVALSPNGRFLFATGAGEACVYVVDVQARQVLSTITTDHLLRDIAFTPDGERVFAAAPGGGWTYQGGIYGLAVFRNTP